MVRKPKLQNAETPAMRRGRLLAERRKRVLRDGIVKPGQRFSSKLQKIFGSNFRNSSLGIRDFAFLRSKSKLKTAIISLFGAKKFPPFATANISAGIIDGKRVLMIDEFQGTYGEKTLCDKFKEDNNGVLWNVALVQSIVDAAYGSGFDRVLLKDISTTSSYHEPHMREASLAYSGPEEWRREVRKYRQRMKNLYDKTRNACNFSKEEWHGDERYWVREFP